MGQLEEMNLFIRVVEAGGISRAAEQLGIAKSAVSRQLMHLETRLGVSLLNRTTRRSRLTEAGEDYYERAVKIVDDVSELNALTTDANCALEGSINFAAPLSFGLCHLTAAIDDFVRQNPRIRINIDFSDRQIDLIEEGFDLAFRIAKLKDSSLIARKVCPIRIILCASPDYLRAHGTPATPQDLQQHRLLQYHGSGANVWKLLDDEGNEHSVNVSAAITANNGDFLKEMAITGHGIIASPTFICWRAVTAGTLVPIMRDYNLPQLNGYALYPGNRYLSRRVRTLIDFLAGRFGTDPYWDRDIR